MRNWTPEQERLLRELWATHTAGQLAPLLGKTPTAVKSAARRMRLPTKREFWSAEDLGLVRREYRRVKAPELARRLGRTASQVQHTAARLGLARPKAKVDAAFDAELRRLNAEGLPDTEIAARLRCERHTASERRRALGLPAMSHGPVARARTAAATRRQLDRAGLSSLGELRRESYRAYARENGWPEDLRFRAVQILNVLAAEGPRTRRQLAEAIGMPWKGSRKSLTSNDLEGSYLAHLVRRGLVVRMPRLVKGRGRGRSVHLYGLTLEATEMAERHHAAQEDDDPGRGA